MIIRCLNIVCVYSLLCASTLVGVASAQQPQAVRRPPPVGPRPMPPPAGFRQPPMYHYPSMAPPPESYDWTAHETSHSSRSIVSLSWDMAVGTGSLDDYIGDVSLAGVQFEANWFLSERFALGFSFGWNRFSQVFRQQTYPIENGALTGSTHKFVDFVTPKFLARYHFLPQGKIQPYVGAGVGLAIVSSDVYIADLAVSSSKAAFSLSPEAGVLLPLWSSYGSGGLQLGVRYTLTTASFGSQVFGSVHDAKYLSWQIGFFQAM